MTFSSIFCIRKTTLLATCICASPLVMAQALANNLTTYVLTSFSGDSLIPVIEPMLAHGGSVRSYQDKLIIRTTPKNYQEIQQLLHQINNVPSTLKVSLKLAENKHDTAQNYAGNIVITARKKATNISGSLRYSQQNRNQQKQSQFHITTLSGSSAHIGAGTLQQFATHFWSSDFIKIDQSMSVTPTLLANNQVRLHVQQRFDQGFNHSNQYPSLPSYPVNTQQSHTSLVTPLGTWQQIGSINQYSQTDASNNKGYRKQNLVIMIKVDKVR